MELAGELDYNGFAQAGANGSLIGLEGFALMFAGQMGTEDEALDLDFETSADVIIDRAGDRARISEFELKMHELTLSGALELNSLSSEMGLDGALLLSEFSPRQLMDDLGVEAPQTSNPSVLSSLHGQARIGGTAENIEFDELQVVLDKSTINGTVSVQSFAPVQMAFDLSMDALNLDDYTVLADDAGAGQEVAAEGAGLLVGSMLFFTGEGSLGISRLTMLGLHAQDVELGLISHGNEIRLFPIRSQFYGGQHQGDIRIVFEGQWPVLTANQMVTGLDAATFLQDLSGSGRLHGVADVYFQVRSQVGSEEMARQTLSGDVGFSVLDGVIDGIDINGAIEGIRALLGRTPAEPAAQAREENMAFSEITATGIIERGVLRSDDLVVRSPYVSATGRGTVNLVNETVNYLIEPVPINELALELPDEYRGIAIPVRVSGNLFDPNVAFDVAGGIAAAQKAQLLGKAGELLGDLLGGKDKKKNRERD
jgi:AsmA protein